jgi:hypothetical protein
LHYRKRTVVVFCLGVVGFPPKRFLPRRDKGRRQNLTLTGATFSRDASRIDKFVELLAVTEFILAALGMLLERLCKILERKIA